MSKKGLLIINELVWIIVFLIISAIIIFPVYQKIPEFPFLKINFFTIFLFLYLSRYILFLKKSILKDKRLLLKIMFFLFIPTVLFLGDSFFTILAFFKEYGFSFIPERFSYLEAKTLGNYLKTEITFFGIASIITAVIFPFRILFYLWKTSGDKPSKWI